MKKVAKIQIAQNYAEALYEAAVQDNLLEKVWADSMLLADVFAASPELNILNNPGWKKQQKQDLIQQIAQKLELSRTMANFLQLIAENGRISDVSAIMTQFKHVYYKGQGILEVGVECVQPLSPAQNTKLKKGLEKLLKQPVVINYNINPEILGGLTVQFGSMRIDDSLAGRLNRLEQVMKGKL